VEGVVTRAGHRLSAKAVVAGCDPVSLRDLVGADRFSVDFNAWLDARERPGSSLKLNLALKKPPRFACLPDGPTAIGPTIHLLPEEPDVLGQLEEGRAAAGRGELPERPAIEWYVHSTVDPTLTDPEGHLSSALFVQWVPYRLARSTWDEQGDRFADHLLSICDRFAPGTSANVVDRMLLHPPAIERHFGMRGGHIHHIDNSFGFTDRFPHRTPIDGLYSCSAGTHPAGSVVGSAGYIAANRLLRDLGKRPAHGRPT
jgi:phytoene dehydrogenase-like protein